MLGNIITVIGIIIPWWRAAVPLPRRGQHQTDCSFCGREPFCRALQYISGARPGASGCLVRLADAPSRRRRSGAVIQSGAQLGALGPARIGGNRSRGRVATPCRQDRRSKTENGSSNPATTVMRFASALARSRARSRSGGVDCPGPLRFRKAKGRPSPARPVLIKAARAVRLLLSAARC